MEELSQEDREELIASFIEARDGLSVGMRLENWEDVPTASIPTELDPDFNIILPAPGPDGRNGFDWFELEAAIEGAIMGVLATVAPGSWVLGQLRLKDLDW